MSSDDSSGSELEAPVMTSTKRKTKRGSSSGAARKRGRTAAPPPPKKKKATTETPTRRSSRRSETKNSTGEEKKEMEDAASAVAAAAKAKRNARIDVAKARIRLPLRSPTTSAAEPNKKRVNGDGNDDKGADVPPPRVAKVDDAEAAKAKDPPVEEKADPPATVVPTPHHILLHQTPAESSNKKADAEEDGEDKAVASFASSAAAVKAAKTGSPPSAADPSADKVEHGGAVFASATARLEDRRATAVGENGASDDDQSSAFDSVVSAAAMLPPSDQQRPGGFKDAASAFGTGPAPSSSGVYCDPRTASCSAKKTAIFGNIARAATAAGIRKKRAAAAAAANASGDELSVMSGDSRSTTTRSTAGSVRLHVRVPPNIAEAVGGTVVAETAATMVGRAGIPPTFSAARRAEELKFLRRPRLDESAGRTVVPRHPPTKGSVVDGGGKKRTRPGSSASSSVSGNETTARGAPVGGTAAVDAMKESADNGRRQISQDVRIPSPSRTDVIASDPLDPKGAFNHVGNRRFRVTVEWNLKSYFQRKVIGDDDDDDVARKRKKVAEILGSLREATPPARFLKRSGRAGGPESAAEAPPLGFFEAMDEAESSRYVHFTFLQAGKAMGYVQGSRGAAAAAVILAARAATTKAPAAANTETGASSGGGGGSREALMEQLGPRLAEGHAQARSLPRGSCVERGAARSPLPSALAVARERKPPPVAPAGNDTGIWRSARTTSMVRTDQARAIVAEASEEDVADAAAALLGQRRPRVMMSPQSAAAAHAPPTPAIENAAAPMGMGGALPIPPRRCVRFASRDVDLMAPQMQQSRRRTTGEHLPGGGGSGGGLAGLAAAAGLSAPVPEMAPMPAHAAPRAPPPSPHATANSPGAPPGTALSAAAASATAGGGSPPPLNILLREIQRRAKIMALESHLAALHRAAPPEGAAVVGGPAMPQQAQGQGRAVPTSQGQPHAAPAPQQGQGQGLAVPALGERVGMPPPQRQPQRSPQFPSVDAAAAARSGFEDGPSACSAAPGSTIVTPAKADVLVVSGTIPPNHVGNRRFRTVVELNLRSYLRAADAGKQPQQEGGIAAAAGEAANLSKRARLRVIDRVVHTVRGCCGNNNNQGLQGLHHGGRQPQRQLPQPGRFLEMSPDLRWVELGPADIIGTCDAAFRECARRYRERSGWWMSETLDLSMADDVREEILGLIRGGGGAGTIQPRAPPTPLPPRAAATAGAGQGGALAVPGGASLRNSAMARSTTTTTAMGRTPPSDDAAFPVGASARSSPAAGEGGGNSSVASAPKMWSSAASAASSSTRSSGRSPTVSLAGSATPPSMPPGVERLQREAAVLLRRNKTAGIIHYEKSSKNPANEKKATHRAVATRVVAAAASAKNGRGGTGTAEDAAVKARAAAAAMAREALTDLAENAANAAFAEGGGRTSSALRADDGVEGEVEERAEPAAVSREIAAAAAAAKARAAATAAAAVVREKISKNPANEEKAKHRAAAARVVAAAASTKNSSGGPVPLMHLAGPVEDVNAAAATRKAARARADLAKNANAAFAEGGGGRTSSALSAVDGVEGGVEDPAELAVAPRENAAAAADACPERESTTRAPSSLGDISVEEAVAALVGASDPASAHSQGDDLRAMARLAMQREMKQNTLVATARVQQIQNQLEGATEASHGCNAISNAAVSSNTTTTAADFPVNGDAMARSGDEDASALDEAQREEAERLSLDELKARAKELLRRREVLRRRQAVQRRELEETIQSRAAALARERERERAEEVDQERRRVSPEEGRATRGGEGARPDEVRSFDEPEASCDATVKDVAEEEEEDEEEDDEEDDGERVAKRRRYSEPRRVSVQAEDSPTPPKAALGKAASVAATPDASKKQRRDDASTAAAAEAHLFPSPNGDGERMPLPRCLAKERRRGDLTKKADPTHVLRSEVKGQFDDASSDEEGEAAEQRFCGNDTAATRSPEPPTVAVACSKHAPAGGNDLLDAVVGGLMMMRDHQD